MKIAVIGAGFSGAVIARELAEAGHRVDVFESRPHIGGNCHTRRHFSTGVMEHVYGPHIFHTGNERVWDYIRKFGEMVPYNHKVKAIVHGQVFSLPINLHTINQFFGKNLSPEGAKEFIERLGDKSIGEPKSFEDQALKFVGRDLYEAFFKGYTEKQWGRDPKIIPASVLSRLPVRFDYNDSYFAHPHQALPRHGYTDIIAAMLDHEAIKVVLNARITAEYTIRYEHTFYSGPLDAYFDHEFGRLAYRTMKFDTKIVAGDGQGTPVMNYCDADIKFTRINEYKHFAPWETHTRSLLTWETSHECGEQDEPYYPIRLVEDKAQLAQYEAVAKTLKSTTFVGRLGTYRYLDMDVAIGEALTTVDKFLGRC